MTCPLCRKADAFFDDYWGWLPCISCQEKDGPHAGTQSEYIPEYMRDDRKAHITDIMPPHRKGELDRGFIERYGKKAARERGFTDREIKNAKYVWDGSDTNTYYKKGN